MRRTRLLFGIILSILCVLTAYTGYTSATPVPGNGQRCVVDEGICLTGTCCKWTYVPDSKGGPGSYTFVITTGTQYYPICKPGTSSDNCVAAQYDCFGGTWIQEGPWLPDGPWICDWTTPGRSVQGPLQDSCPFPSCVP